MLLIKGAVLVIFAASVIVEGVKYKTKENGIPPVYMNGSIFIKIIKYGPRVMIEAGAGYDTIYCHGEIVQSLSEPQKLPFCLGKIIPADNSICSPMTHIEQINNDYYCQIIEPFYVKQGMETPHCFFKFTAQNFFETCGYHLKDANNIILLLYKKEGKMRQNSVRIPSIGGIYLKYDRIKRKSSHAPMIPLLMSEKIKSGSAIGRKSLKDKKGLSSGSTSE